MYITLSFTIDMSFKNSVVFVYFTVHFNNLYTNSSLTKKRRKKKKERSHYSDCHRWQMTHCNDCSVSLQWMLWACLPASTWALICSSLTVANVTSSVSVHKTGLNPGDSFIWPFLNLLRSYCDDVRLRLFAAMRQLICELSKLVQLVLYIQSGSLRCWNAFRKPLNQHLHTVRGTSYLIQQWGHQIQRRGPWEGNTTVFDMVPVTLTTAVH